MPFALSYVYRPSTLPLGRTQYRPNSTMSQRTPMTRLLRFVDTSRLLDHTYSVPAQGFLTSFLTTGDDLELSIKGDSDSTPFASLSTALEGVSLSGSIKGMNANPILTHVNVYITVSGISACPCPVLMVSDSHVQLSTLVTNLVEVDFDVHNPLGADLQITRVQADSGVNNEVYALYVSLYPTFASMLMTLDAQLQSRLRFVCRAGRRNSEQWPLRQRAPDEGGSRIAAHHTLGLPRCRLRANRQVCIHACSPSRLGFDTCCSVAVGGYEIPWLQLWQPNTPTTYVHPPD